MATTATATPPTVQPGGFGSAFLRTGKFKTAGREKIRNAGFSNVKDFLSTNNFDPTNRDGLTTQSLANALAKGKPPAATVAPTTAAAPVPTITENLATQGVNLANTGVDVQNQAQGSFGNSLLNANQANNPALSSGVSNFLNAQRLNNQDNIKNYFNTKPLDVLRSRLGQQSVDAQQTGLSGSRTDNQIQAALQRGFVGDRANALMDADNLANQNQLDQLNQGRNTSVGLAGMFGQQGAQQLAAGLGTQNQGFQNQLDALKTGAGLSQQDFNNALQSLMAGNQISQQTLQNIQAAAANRFNKSMTQQQFDLQKQMLESQQGSWWKSLLGAGAGAAIGGFI